MEKYEVVIIGAGPGGLKAAEVLASHGINVLVLEKKSKIGPKVCAGGITRKCLELGIPPEILERSFNSIHLNTKYQKNISVSFEDNVIHTVDRNVLGEYMSDNAIKAGAQIRKETFVDSIEDNFVSFGGEKVAYDYLIGADGSNSLVRRYLNIPVKRTGIGFQYIIKGNIDNFELYFDKDRFNAWYAWVFPYKDCFSVGTGGDVNFFNVKKLRKELDNFCIERSFDFKSSKFEAATIGTDYCGFKFGKVFLVGDAGGFTSGFSGEGIYPAIISGEIAAKSIIDSTYDFRSDLSNCLKQKRQHEFLLNLLKGPFVSILHESMVFSARFKYTHKMIVDFFA